ncbi:MAG TPA: 50S ribosomal protein L11 methyltransferase [Candidatus Coprenecus pullistercoris]|nr:50S ribosomal protein L11 methyltransferase [Candidatus Coprenecus pullistercoris]
MEYIEVSIEITPFKEEYAEIVTAEIEDLGFESYLTEEPYLKAYIPREQFSEPKLRTVLGLIPETEFKVRHTLSMIQEQNWNALWESSFEPVVIDGRCTIKASFHKGLPRTKYTIVIDPKMAFGTGHHQTTSLIIKSMMQHEKEIKGKQVLDMGCGTGILSILAAKMKAAVPVHAIDIDPVAVNSARENARRNRTGDRITTLCGDASLIQAGKYDLIIANINRNIILEDLSTYSRGLRPEGRLITSGFYVEDCAMIEAEAARQGLTRTGGDSLDRWATVTFVKTSNPDTH